LTIKMGSGLWQLNLLVITLIVTIIFIPSELLRIILSLPFLIFIPGYALVMIIFPSNKRIGGIERVALSFGLSIAVAAFIGLILNYTWWGITLESTLYSIASSIFVMSVIAEARRQKLQKQERFVIEFQWRLPGWGDSVWSKLLSVVLVIAILGALGMLGYVLATPKVGEKFTEFYILGPGGMVQDYPTEFVMEGNKVILVKYGDDEIQKTETGSIIVGIINREHEAAEYIVRVLIDEEQVPVYLDGVKLDELGPITLAHEEKWEREIGFAPEHVGNDQKVDFVLYEDGAPYFEEPLYFWINVNIQN
jgi:uncharacterized membrane protein